MCSADTLSSSLPWPTSIPSAILREKDTTPEEFFGSYQSRLADAKKRAADLEAAKPEPTASISNAAGLTKWKKSSGHYTRWETSIPKDHKVVVADAAALRAGILKNLESSGATVERGTLLSEAAERANDRFIAPSSKVPSFDKSKLIELAKDAESMLQMQETTLPVLTSKADRAELAALLSALSGAPIDLSLAFTGAVSQSGAIMAVGGVSRKVEGFFEARIQNREELFVEGATRSAGLAVG